MSPSLVGSLMLGTNLLAALSSVLAAPLVNRIGAIRTMIFTHLPSNIFLILLPFMPTRELAGAMLLARYSISQMDNPARQTFLQLAVESDERSAAGGIANVMRAVGMSISPQLVGYFLGYNSTSLMFGMPFIAAGVSKLLYDILLYVVFITMPDKAATSVGISKARDGNLQDKSSGETRPLLSEQQLKH